MARDATYANKKATTTARYQHGRPKIGYHFLHTAVDDHSRLAYAEILTDDEQHTPPPRSGPAPPPGSPPPARPRCERSPTTGRATDPRSSRRSFPGIVEC
jgi:hypothetical protein